MDDERALIRRAQGGDHDSFLALLARYDRHVMSVVYRFTCDQYDREDLYQEVFLHSFRSLESYRFRSSFQTWLYRLALNRCISYMKKRVPVAEPRDEDAAAPAVDWERREKLRTVERALGRLDGPQRICFHLHYIEDWGVGQLAELLDCREGTVKSHLDRARKKIRKDHEVLLWQTNP